MAWSHGEGSSSRIEFDKGGGFGDFWGLNCEKEQLDDDDDHKGGKSNKGSDEITDLLPSDPFNMESSIRGTDFTGWLEDFEKDFGFKAEENYKVAKLDSFLTGKMRVHELVRLQLIDGNPELFGMSFREGLDGGHGLMVGNKEIMDFSYGKYWNLGDTTDINQGGINDPSEGPSEGLSDDGGDPSDALLLALGYLGLRDLLAVERVCKPLRDAVIGDPLLWRNIDIDPPLCTKITNDILIKLTNRAQGHLHSLILYHCSKITDDGLKHVLERNPNLSKLNVSGSARLTADGMLSNLKVLKTTVNVRLKYLGIYGLSGLTNKHIEEFKLLTGVDNSKLPTTCKPRFFGGGQWRVIFDDDRAMDVEVCPKCQKLELVYDCPSESCRKKQSSSQLCRACTKCITRCFDCGYCLNNCDYVELLHFELLCLECRRKHWQKEQQKMSFFSETTVVHKGKGYHFVPFGLYA